MRVGLNLAFWSQRAGGAGTYARELIPAMLAVEPGLRLTAWAPRDRPRHDWDDAVEWIRLPFEAGGGPPHVAAARLAAQWVAMPAAARRRRLDVLHGLTGVVAPVVPGVATVATVLDLIWLRDTESMGRRDTLTMKATVLPSARRADRVIAISQATKDDVVRTLGLPAGRVDVTLLGVRMDAPAQAAPVQDVNRAFDLGDAPVLLCVAQKRSHKNLEALVRALPRLADRDAVLVLPGAPTPYEERLHAVAAELGVSERLRTPGWVSDAELEGLYARATVFALPSFEEGFGLPVLEAMRRDVPVACSNAASLPEVAGDAAELFDPHDVADLARALDRLLADPARRSELVERGRARCRVLTWERTARATLETYQRAIGA